MSNFEAVTGPTVWHGATFAGKEDVTLTFGASELRAIDKALSATRHLALEDIEPHHFSDPVLAQFMRQLGEEVLHGRGLVVLAGVPMQNHDEESLSRIFWGLGNQLGNPVSQSVMGERLGHVVDKSADDPTARGYRQRYELTPHNDFHEIVTFMCLQQGIRGGRSWCVSSHLLHNLMLESRPDLLEALYRGYFTHRFGEQGDGEGPITEHRVPVFSRCEGELSCRFLRRYIEAAANEAQALSRKEREALEYFDAIAMDADNGLFFDLEPGEAVIMNNYVVLHGRTAFEDGHTSANKRHLVRLWLTVEPPRPVMAQVAVYASELEGAGIVPRPGRVPSYDDSETVQRIYGDRMPGV